MKNYLNQTFINKKIAELNSNLKDIEAKLETCTDEEKKAYINILNFAKQGIEIAQNKPQNSLNFINDLLKKYGSENNNTRPTI